MEYQPLIQNRHIWRSRYVNIVAILGVGLLYCLHLALIATYAVDFPFGDEWDAFPRQPYISWIWAPHNEHRIITTKLLILGLYWLNGWNLYVQQILNFGIYGVVLATFAYFLRRRQGIPLVGVCLALIWMLSPMPFENHIWAFQTQFHLALLFFLAAVCCLFDASRAPNSWRGVRLGAVALVLCVLSLSSGISASIAVVAVYAARRLWLYRNDKDVTHLRQVGALVLPLVVLIAAYMFHFERPVDAAPLTTPFSTAFAVHFFTLVASSTWVGLSESGAVALGIVIVVFQLYPWLAIWGNRQLDEEDDRRIWGLTALFLGIGAILVAISVGRACFGWNQATSSRYREFSGLIWPIGACAYYRMLRFRPVAARYGLAITLLITVVAWLNSIKMFSAYQLQYMVRTRDASVLRDQYRHREDGVILDNYAKRIPYARLEEAWHLRLSFTRVPDAYLQTAGTPGASP